MCVGVLCFVASLWEINPLRKIIKERFAVWRMFGGIQRKYLIYSGAGRSEPEGRRGVKNSEECVWKLFRRRSVDKAIPAAIFLPHWTCARPRASRFQFGWTGCSSFPLIWWSSQNISVLRLRVRRVCLLVIGPAFTARPVLTLLMLWTSQFLISVPESSKSHAGFLVF